jgi:hypothetical protein
MSDHLARTKSSYKPERDRFAPRDVLAAFREGLGYYCGRGNPTADPIVEFRWRLVALSAIARNAVARGHRDEAREAYAPSMAQRPELHIERLYRRALHRLPESMDEVPPLPVPAECPVTLDELLAPPP